MHNAQLKVKTFPNTLRCEVESVGIVKELGVDYTVR
jgi:hypothetical protein